MVSEGTALFFESRVKVGLGGLESGSKAKGNSSRAGNKQGKGENANVGSDLEGDGAPERRESRSNLDDQKMERPACQRQCKGSGENSEKDAFGQQLAK